MPLSNYTRAIAFPAVPVCTVCGTHSAFDLVDPAGGFVLGMAFPLGLSFTSRKYPQFVAWAWGMNGYATVFGSVLSIILALHFGFRTVLLLASGIYILSYFSLSSAS